VLRVATLNVNGIRAAVRRGYLDWAARRAPDVICLQEVRSPPAAIPDGVTTGYHWTYHEGDRRGRNGVAVLSREAPGAVRIGFGSAEFDRQGRYVEVDLPGITVGSLYLPKGATDGEILDGKLRFMAEFASYLARARRRAGRAGRELLVCGDYNIAHTQNDLKAWRTNRRSPGFLPIERDWIGDLISTGGLVDVLRLMHPGQAGPYTWWSWRGRSWDTDAGWRIDHQLATPALAARATASGVDRAPDYRARMSDHAPVVVDYQR
jgi:exodeoxyribonuclease-3